MRQLFLLLLLLTAKTITAQSLYLGPTVGGLDYKFRQQSQYTSLSYWAMGVSGNYTFKDSLPWGVEANVYYYPSGENNSTYIYEHYKGLTVTGYFCVNPFPNSKAVNIKLKAGWFYTAYLNNSLPAADYGPAISLYLGVFKIGKHGYLGVDAAWLWGLQNYNIYGLGEYSRVQQQGNSNISYIHYAIKYIISFNNLV